MTLEKVENFEKITAVKFIRILGSTAQFFLLWFINLCFKGNLFAAAVVFHLESGKKLETQVNNYLFEDVWIGMQVFSQNKYEPVKVFNLLDLYRKKGLFRRLHHLYDEISGLNLCQWVIQFGGCTKGSSRKKKPFTNLVKSKYWGYYNTCIS